MAVETVTRAKYIPEVDGNHYYRDDTNDPVFGITNGSIHDFLPELAVWRNIRSDLMLRRWSADRLIFPDGRIVVIKVPGVSSADSNRARDEIRQFLECAEEFAERVGQQVVIYNVCKDGNGNSVYAKEALTEDKKDEILGLGEANNLRPIKDFNLGFSTR